MARNQRSPSELRALSKHLHYEYDMVVRIVQVLASGALGQSALNNAAVESFVMHCRVLKDFLYNDAHRYPDDAIAQDFFLPDVEWKSIRPPLTSSLSALEKRAGKEIAHLTYTRLDGFPDAKQWHFPELFRDLQTVLDAFLSAAPVDNLHPCWRS